MIARGLGIFSVAVFLFSEASFAWAEEKTPRILMGDWFPIQLQCGDPRALKEGWYFSENLSMQSLNGIYSCQFEEWKIYDPASIPDRLGEWSYEVICNNNSDSSSSSRRYGWMSVDNFKSEVRLNITESDKEQSSFFDDPGDISGLQLRRCE